jgi:hypothetical protein
MDPTLVSWREDQRKRLGTTPVKVDAIRIISYPSFGTENLIGRLLYRSLIPPSPIEKFVISFGKLAGFIRENNDVVAEHNQEIAQFLAVTYRVVPSLITVQVGVTPKPEK